MVRARASQSLSCHPVFDNGCAVCEARNPDNRFNLGTQTQKPMLLSFGFARCRVKVRDRMRVRDRACFAKLEHAMESVALDVFSMAEVHIGK